MCARLSLGPGNSPEVSPDRIIETFNARLGKPLRFVKDECGPRNLCNVVYMQNLVGRRFCERHPCWVVVFGVSISHNGLVPHVAHVEVDQTQPIVGAFDWKVSM